MQQDQPDHSPWYQPRTAEIIQRGGEGMANSIGQGLQQFGAGIGSGLQERWRRKEQEKRDAMEGQRTNLAVAQFAEEQKSRQDKKTALGKSADYFFKANESALAEFGHGKDTYKDLSTDDRIGMFEAVGRNMVLKQEMQKFQQQKQDAGAIAKFQRSNTNMTTPMQIPAGTFGPMYGGETIGGPISSEDRFNLMQKAGVNPEDQYKLMRAYGEMGGGEGARADLGAIQYDPVPNIPGAVGWRRGNMAGIVQDPNVKADAYSKNRGQVTPAIEFADAGRREKAAMDALKDPIITTNPELKAYWSNELEEARRAKKTASGGESTVSAPAATSATNRFKIVELK